MIGVVVEPDRLATAAELFELFKTPWEPAVPHRRYAAIVGVRDACREFEADVVLAFGAFPSGDGPQWRPVTKQAPAQALHAGEPFPLYGPVKVQAAQPAEVPLTLDGNALAYRASVDGRVVWQIGYDVFAEVDHLLRKGQPASHAAVPTLELHIAVLRDLLVRSGVSFAEIPPRPSGHDYICCLTHDIDFFGIRRHRFDRTLAGFLARASVGSLVDVATGRRSLGEAIRNWRAVASLPLVFAGTLEDFWSPADDYVSADGAPSTFFVVPFKGQAGVGPDGRVNSRRAVAYEIAEVREAFARAVERGCEVAVHGIDAWRDAEAGRRELAQCAPAATEPVGIRMHWLYNGDDTPALLEAAGYDYDSTWGYNEACGYRAGTAQAFKPHGVGRLLEMPLTLMDSALFFPDRMGLNRDAAARVWRRLLANAQRFGGAFVVNWHDRSLAPERLWTHPYRVLLRDIREHGRAWFATMRQAAGWFRWRRSIRFERRAAVGIEVVVPALGDLPSADMVIYRNGHPGTERISLVPGGALTVPL